MDFLSQGIYYGTSIALIIHSVDRSLFSHLIAIHSVEGFTIALTIHSLDRLQ